MSTTGLGVFDHAVQEANLWLNGLAQKLLPGADRHDAYLVFRAVLHALRDRLPLDHAVHLGAKLPMLLRGVYFEGWHVHGAPNKERHKAEFLAHVGRELKGSNTSDLESSVYVVMQLLREHIDAGEIKKLLGVLPGELRLLLEPPLDDGAPPPASYRPRDEAS